MDNINVLVAEDNEFNQLVIKQLISDLGFGFVIVNNGQEAIAQLSRQKFDIVFMDIEMPVMDGIEATQVIRSSPDEIQMIPIIGFTGHKDPNVLNILRNKGFNDFVTKPFSKNDLKEKIDRYVFSSDGKKADAKLKEVIHNEPKGKLYDLTNLREFSDMDERFVIKMLTYFIGNSPKVILKMKEYFFLNAWEELRMEAHKFNSELGLLGISQMMDLTGKIEEITTDMSELDVLLSYIDQLQKQSQLVVDQLKSDFKI